MVEDIIKAVNKKFIYVSKNSFDEMKNTCKEKLLACQSHSEDKFKAFFDCNYLEENQLIELLEICNQTNTLFLGFISTKKEKNIKIIQHKIYSGETYTFDGDILIIHDIPKDSYIECSGNIIVLGKVKGNIHLYYKDNTIAASSFEQANLCIFDTQFQNMTSFSSCLYYYKNKKIMKEEQNGNLHWNNFR